MTACDRDVPEELRAEAVRQIRRAEALPGAEALAAARVRAAGIPGAATADALLAQMLALRVEADGALEDLAGLLEQAG